MKSKKELRQQISGRLVELGLTRPQVSLHLLRNLRSLGELWSVQSLAGYVAFGHEPDLRLFFQDWLAAGRCLLLPRYDSTAGCYEMAAVNDIVRDTVPGHYGISEPAPLLPKAILSSDFPASWLVPGLAFSLTGVRLGRGAGYYDRLLEPSSGLKIGVCLECQLFAELPELRHDVKMHFIVTEARIIKCQEKAEELAP